MFSSHQPYSTRSIEKSVCDLKLPCLWYVTLLSGANRRVQKDVLELKFKLGILSVYAHGPGAVHTHHDRPQIETYKDGAAAVADPCFKC